MRAVVLEQEEQKRRNIETLQRAMKLEEEAARLKRKLKIGLNVDKKVPKKVKVGMVYGSATNPTW